MITSKNTFLLTSQKVNDNFQKCVFLNLFEMVINLCEKISNLFKILLWEVKD